MIVRWFVWLSDPIGRDALGFAVQCLRLTHHMRRMVCASERRSSPFEPVHVELFDSNSRFNCRVNGVGSSTTKKKMTWQNVLAE